MIGFWKTNQIVTLGLFHCIGPSNGYTHTLHIHSAITRLVNWSAFLWTSFADPVNSLLRQWDPWRALHGRHGSEIHPSDSKMSLRPSKHGWVYGWYFLDSYLFQAVLAEGLTHLWLPTLPSTHPTAHCHFLVAQYCRCLSLIPWWCWYPHRTIVTSPTDRYAHMIHEWHKLYFYFTTYLVF